MVVSRHVWHGLFTTGGEANGQASEGGIDVGVRWGGAVVGGVTGDAVTGGVDGEAVSGAHGVYGGIVTSVLLSEAWGGGNEYVALVYAVCGGVWVSGVDDVSGDGRATEAADYASESCVT